MWDEIKIRLTADSDLDLARETLLRCAKEVVSDYLEVAQNSWKGVADTYRLENPSLEPTVSLVVNSGSLEFTVSYIVDYATATSMKDRLFTRIVQELMKSNGKLILASSSSSIATIQSEAVSSPTNVFQFLSR